MPKVIPPELVSLIAEFLVWTHKLCERTSQSVLAKNEFEKGMAGVNKAYRAIYMHEWFRSMTLHKVEDWDTAKDLDLAGHIRVLTLKENALPSYALVKVHLDFSRFDFIHTLTLDCHNDVGQSASLGIKGQWSYKKIVPALPRKLKSLTILNAHGPDLQIIQKAIKQCIDLESLTLGRCTKFNRPTGCEFWGHFPNDHDSYFSGQGVEGYANALGTELQGLPKLKYIFVNVYLTDTKYLNETSSVAAPTEEPQPQPPPTTELVTVTSKRAPNAQVQAHLPLPVNSNPAQPERREVKSKDQKDTEEAEKKAADLLFGCHSSLQIVGFISYWSEDHLGWSVYERNDGELKSPDPGGRLDGANTVRCLQS
ncbi:unnamed protein product [Rhizoctonia solani]|uniref:Uncharacterized protein n=1 Tax=Rhizoctonia solani TaxID=456999 RepID=A0A8H2Y131_9AGAM|nr:unnamed protein product [Rhizoctonia solani]